MNGKWKIGLSLHTLDPLFGLHLMFSQYPTLINNTHLGVWSGDLCKKSRSALFPDKMAILEAVLKQQAFPGLRQTPACRPRLSRWKWRRWRLRRRSEPKQLSSAGGGSNLWTSVSHSHVHLSQPPPGLTRSPSAKLAELRHLTAPWCPSCLFLSSWLFHTLQGGSNIFSCHDKTQRFQVSGCNWSVFQGSELWQGT